MRWSEIVIEELSVIDRARSSITDMISSLKAQKVEQITVDQILDQLRSNPDFESNDLEADLVISALEGVKDLKIEPDPETGKMTVFIGGIISSRQVDADQAEKEAKDIKKAALRAIKAKD